MSIDNIETGRYTSCKIRQTIGFAIYLSSIFFLSMSFVPIEYNLPVSWAIREITNRAQKS